MAKFYVMVRDSADYEIEAENEEQAVEKAYEYWLQREPDIFVDSEEESEE